MLYVLNFVAFQAGWFSSVLGGAQQMPWLGPIAVTLALLLHFRFARARREELILILSCAAIGAAFDSALVAMGWVRYSSGMFSEYAAPYWIITMWMLFATTLNVSMRWLRNRQVLAAACGLFGGPIAYLTGQKLGGIILVDQWAALLALGIGWAIMMPGLLWLSAMYDGFATPGKVPATAATKADPGA
jgi:Protein of unknown function (DUF2878)